MRESEYLRLALMFGDNNASTFKKNLEKMIMLVLYDSYDEPQNVISIIEKLKDYYRLDFSEHEILDVIDNQRQNRIICNKKSIDRAECLYSISPSAKEALDKKTTDISIEPVVEQFLEENKDIDCDQQSFEGTLKKYFYSIFNSNAATISELLNKNATIDFDTNINFSDEEKLQINAFLEWNNKTKDRYVFQMVSCCFDYCMMTIKRNKNIYANIFRKKVFYLDTNIIFRMMGLNQANRKKLIDTFIRKCKDAGIELRYTNQTKQEIYNTIDYRVKQIKELLRGNNPISVESVRSMTSKFYNLSFYEAYVKWCKEKANRPSDYNSFADDLKIQANNIMHQFVPKDFDSFENLKSKEFEEHYLSLKSFKEARRGYAKDEVIQTDVNNYMFVRQQNDKEKATDFFNTHNYLISADHVLGDWAREMRPGTVPIVVLPSVWYSLILQYTGRTDDDYASFTRFLNFSVMSLDDDQEDDTRKFEILRKVIALNEPNEIKERTLYDIEKKLQTDYKYVDSADEIVETSHEYILDQERTIIAEQYKKESEERVEQVKTEIEARLAEEKARHANKEYELIKENKELLNTVEDARSEGERNRAERLADQVLLKTIILYWGIALLLAAIGIYFIVVAIDKSIDGSLTWLKLASKSAPAMLDLLLSIIIGIADFVVIRKFLCDLDRESIRDRLIRRFMK